MIRLPRAAVRKFLFLLDLAETENLTRLDKATWLRICDWVDFQQFSIDCAAPHYAEGMLCSRGKLTVVEWCNGCRETLDWHVAQALREVDPGERFSAFVKLGKDNKALAIERVSLLSPVKMDGWESWPAKRDLTTTPG